MKKSTIITGILLTNLGIISCNTNIENSVSKPVSQQISKDLSENTSTDIALKIENIQMHWNLKAKFI